MIIIIFSQSRSALQLAQTELFRAQIEYSVGDAYTVKALSFGQMISGHVQGPYGEPKFAPIMGYRSVGDERGLFFKLLDSNSNSNLQIQTSFVSYPPYAFIGTQLGSPYGP